MTDVFISYAREDRKFVQRLHDALASAGRESWVDWEGIPASAKWMAEVRAAIDEADCFCFVVSSDSVESPVCREEAAHAAASNKRILPLLHRQVEDGLVPETVAAHNWIEFDQEQDFEKAFATLVKALETEPEHLRTHTRLLVRAKEWEVNKANRSYLLRGQDLTQAESWLGSAQGKEPSPTQLHTAYVIASRKAASRRQRTTVGAVALALVLSLVLATVAVIQRSQAQDAQVVAEEQRATAEEQTRLALSRQLGSQALLSMDERLDVAALLAVEGYRTAPTAESLDAVRTVALATAAVDRFLVAPGTGDAAFSDDGRLIAAGSGIDVVVWDAQTGAELAVLPGGERDFEVKALAFSPDGHALAVGHFAGGVRLWDTATWEPGAELEWPGNDTFDLTFAPSGLLVTAGVDGSLRAWDPDNGTQVWGSRDAHGSAPVLSVAVSPDGQLLASGGDDGAVHLWDPRTGRSLGPTMHGPDWIHDLVFGLDGDVLVAASVEQILVFDPETGRERYAPMVGHDGEVFQLAAHGSMLVSGGTDRAIRVWDLSTGSPLSPSVRGQQATIAGIAFGADGETFASASGDVVTVWSLAGLVGTPAGSSTAVEGSPVEVTDLAFDATSSFVAASVSQGDVLLLEPGNGRPTLTWHGLDGRLNAIAVSPDGAMIATGGEDGIRLWDAQSGKALSDLLSGSPVPPGTDLAGIPAEYLPPPRAVYSMAFSPDGSMLLAGMGDGSVRRWDVAERRPIGDPVTGHVLEVFGVAFAPDGSWFASVGNLEDGYGVLAWTADTTEQIGSGQAGDLVPTTVAFSPDGAEIFVGGYGPEVVSFSTDPIVQTDRVIPAQDRVADMAVSPDGSLLATVGDGGSVRLWDLAEDRLLMELSGHRASVLAVAFSPDGRSLASGGMDGAIRLWDSLLWSSDLAVFTDAACGLLGRSLTQQEWETFAPGAEYHATCGSPD